MTEIKQIRRSVVSEVQFPNHTDLDSIKNHIRRLKGTGKLIIHFSQGGVNAVTFEARNLLNGHEHIELQFSTPDIT